MLPYVLLLLIPAILPLLVYRPSGAISECGKCDLSQKRNKMTLILFFLIFFVLLALRDISVGKDLRTYEIIFERCRVTSFDNLSQFEWEFGYIVYTKIVSILLSSYRLYLILSALIMLIPIYKLYSVEKKYSYLAILLFVNMPCFLMIFSGLRQAIAISVGIVAYIVLEKRRYILSGILILLAVSFHMSAFVLVLIYPAFFLKIKTKDLIFIVPVIFVIYICRVPIIQFMIRLMPSHYMEFYGDIEKTGAVGMMILFVIFSVFSFVILDENSMSNRDYFMRNVLLIATVFQFFVPIHGLVQRASYYFLIFSPVSILRVVQAPKKYLKNISNLAVLIMGCFFALYFFYTANFSTDNLLDVFPYKFYWSGE